MRAYFGVCGVGLGHAGRCIPIAKELEGQGHSVFMSTYGDALDYVRKEGFPLGSAPPLRFVVKDDGSVDFRQTTVRPGPFSVLIFLRQIVAELGFMKLFRPDVVISDSRLSTLVAASLLGIPRLTILNNYRVTIPRHQRFLRLARIADAGILTVIGKSWELGRKILIPDNPPPYTLSEANLGIPRSRFDRIAFVGSILPERPDRLPEEAELRQHLEIGDSEYLLFVPISGSAPERIPLIERLLEIFPTFPPQYRVVMSIGEAGSSNSRAYEENLVVHDWIENRFEFMKASDLVICKAGLGTISQAISFGKPMVVIPTPNHTEQLNNARRARALGVAEIIQQEELDSQVLLSMVATILKDERYSSRARSMSKKVNGLDAVSRAAMIISEVVGSYRSSE